MPSVRSLAILFALVSLLSLSASPLATTPAPAALFQPGTYRAQIIKTTLAPAVVTTFKTIQTAFGKAPAKARALIVKTPKGVPLPYQSWFGVTQAAYSQALAAQPYIVVTGTSTVTVARIGTQGTVLSLTGGKGLEKLNGLQIDVGANTVRTPWGTTSPGREVAVTAPGGLGPRSGSNWLIEQGSVASGEVTNVDLSAMRLAKTGQVLLSYQVAVMRNSLPKQNFVVDLLVAKH